MSSNVSISDAAGIPGFAGIIISAYARETKPVLIMLAIYLALGAICLPLLLAVFYFSTPRIRRTPLFMIVVFDIILGVGVSIWVVTITLTFLFSPQGSYPRVSLISIPIVTFIVPWLVDLVLLLRLYAVFPVVTTSRRTMCAVFGPVASVKAIRLGCGIAVFTSWVPTIPPEPTTLYSSSNMRLAHSPFWKVATACSLVDHTFVAVCFLWKLRAFSLGSRQGSACRQDSITKSLSDRLRMVFYIGIGNFVFPAIFDIVLFFVFCMNSIDFVDPVYLQPVNAYVAIFGVVFATIWSSGHSPAASLTTGVNKYPRHPHGTDVTLALDGIDLERKDKVEPSACA